MTLLFLVLLTLLTLLPLGQAAEDKSERDTAREERQRAEREQELEHQAREHERNYRNGVRNLDKREWEDAIKYFDRVINAKGDRADGALYWKAYAEYKRGEREKAVATLADLRKSFPQSRWLEEAKALEIEVGDANSKTVDPEKQVDEDLKLMALNGLMRSDPARALPILKKLLEGQQPPKVKERALFVLSQTKSPEARKILAEMVRGKSNPDLERKALEYTALFGDQESRQVLAQAYESSPDAKIRRDILRLFMLAGDKERLFAAARNESALELRREAIAQLGELKAQKEVADLYGSENSPELKKRILDALYNSRNAEKLIEVAQNESDAELRRLAVERLGAMEHPKAGQALDRKSVV